jgi:hypothetical protein
MIEVTALTKDGGVLTKHIHLDDRGVLISDGSGCVMSRGHAMRVRLADLTALSGLIERLEPHEAIALGALRDDLPEHVDIATKAHLQKLNGGTAPHLIARTADAICYRARQPALALIDYDSKGMPPWVKARINAIGGVWSSLVGILPMLGAVGRVMRPSTSSGLYRSDTGEQLPGSQNQHIYLQVDDGADINRFLRTLHERCWLAGLGWMVVGAGGQLLERSIVDRMVGAPERLVFEAAPITEAPVAQDRAARAPTVIEGATLNTIAACPALSIVEQAELRRLRTRERQRLAEDARLARDAFIAERAKGLAQRTGMTEERAARIVTSQCEGVLLPDVVLPLDDEELAGATVGDVLADPAHYEGATLADPLEGVAYGICKAKIMRWPDGTPWIHSFAHGRTVYQLKLDMAAATAAVEHATKDKVATTFVTVVLTSALDDAEIETLRNRAAERAGVGIRTLNRMLKDARTRQRQQQMREEEERRVARRTDPRPQILVPEHDAPWLPTMTALNDVLGTSQEPEPPMRDIDGVITVVRVRRLPGMHMLTASSANDDEPVDNRMPPPEHPLLTRLTEPQLAELIERYIEYIDGTGRPVHLPAPFVRHFHTRPGDDALPIVAAVATLPIVLADGSILSGRGLNRARCIVFRVPAELEALLPTAQECTNDVVRDAMHFLMDEWFCDVATDATGKCILIAVALTLIERSLLPDRLTFFVTAGRRGGGKTTTLIMLTMAITGVRPAAAAWSPNEEERRKALLAYLLEATPAIIWDNIARGSQISCPHIERSCTTAFYTDRRLGVSELAAVAAAVIHLFTGNNIGPKGDLASRSLLVRLEVDRADPENREFRHPDPVEWTAANRGRILRALFTILLGNPHLRTQADAPAKTRFKTWWRLVGSAIEHAASVAGISIDFRHLFLNQEEDEEETASLTDALGALAHKWPRETKFLAADVARMVNDRSEFTPDEERQRCETQFLFPNLQPNHIVTAKAVGKRLKRHVGEPVKLGDETLVLRDWRDDNDGPHGRLLYFVRRSGPRPHLAI